MPKAAMKRWKASLKFTSLCIHFYQYSILISILTCASNFNAFPCLCVSFAAGTLLIFETFGTGKHVPLDLWGNCDTRAVVASFTHDRENMESRKRHVHEERLNIRFFFAILPVYRNITFHEYWNLISASHNSREAQYSEYTLDVQIKFTSVC